MKMYMCTLYLLHRYCHANERLAELEHQHREVRPSCCMMIESTCTCRIEAGSAATVIIIVYMVLVFAENRDCA